MMKKILVAITLLAVSFIATAQTRVVVLSDFPPVDVVPGGMGFGDAHKRSDSDDVQSMVRFLLYTNEFDVEGLVATSATFANQANKQNIHDILYLYDAVDENLRKHDARYPTAKQLRKVTWQGRSGTWGKKAEEIVGQGKESEASKQIARLLSKKDERPVWFCVWGGPADLAQALWQLEQQLSQKRFAEVLAKVRVYLIGLQDGSAQWMLDRYPNLFAIISQHNYMGMFNNADKELQPLSDLHWINQHIRKGHGLLGAAYPESGFYPEHPGVWEGDSPSFLYLVSDALGISQADEPWQDSWGGKFVQPDSTKNHWYDAPGGGANVYKWRKAVQDDFAKRADWMLP